MSYTLACSQFRPNFWRPTICAYCYRPKEKHGNGDGNRKGYPSHQQASNEWHFQRCATVSTATPTKSRERILFSEPPADLDEFQDMRRVGVVKPYAVVELNKTWVASSQQDLGGKKSLTLSSNFHHRDRFSPPPLPRPRGTSFTAVAIRSTISPLPYKSSTGPRLMSSSKHGRIIPKRKAPPPPTDGDIRKNGRNKRSSSVPPQSSTDLLDELLHSPQTITKTTCTVKTVPISKPSVVELRSKENSPPRKPPRTQSTFFTELPPSSSQLSLVYPFEAVADKSIDIKFKQPTMFKPPASDYEPLRKPGLVMSSMSLMAPSPTILEQLHEIFNDSLDSLSNHCLHKLSSVQQLWNIEWSDITVRTDEHDNHQLFYHMRPINVEGYDEKIHNSEIEISKSIGQHLNLSIARGSLPQAPTDLMDMLPDAASYIVRDALPGLTPLNKLLPMWQEALDSEKYEQCVLLTLLQVLRSVKHLYCNGVVHRDLGIDTLVAVNDGSNCIIKLGGFQYSLYRPGPLSATTFVYAFHELHWLGGVDTRLPPEIMDTPENMHTLDYANTDCFAVGCLIYELLTGTNPFDENPQLVYVGYSDDDLPIFPITTKMSNHLRTLAHRLLRRDPHKRLGVSDALILVQSMLWLPPSWIEESASKSAIEDHLLVIKGCLLAKLAQREESESIPLELILKAEFLSSCSPSDLVRAFAVFQH